MKKFIVINTAEYNGDNTYAVTEFSADNYEDIGIDENEMREYDKMSVGEISQTDYVGCVVMRVV